jgi:hypothetical protein
MIEGHPVAAPDLIQHITFRRSEKIAWQPKLSQYTLPPSDRLGIMGY